MHPMRLKFSRFGTSSLVQLRPITKTYGSEQTAFQALRGINLDMLASEFVAVMGASGSGKSTEMNLMKCLDSPDSGEYLFDGIHVEQLNKDQRTLLWPLPALL